MKKEKAGKIVVNQVLVVEKGVKGGMNIDISINIKKIVEAGKEVKVKKEEIEEVGAEVEAIVGVKVEVEVEVEVKVEINLKIHTVTVEAMMIKIKKKKAEK